MKKLLCLFTFAVLLLGMTSCDNPKSVVDEFMGYCQKGQYDKAAALVDKNSDDLDADALEEQLEYLDFESEMESYEILYEKVNGKTATIKVKVKLDDNKLKWTFRLKKKKDGWKISDITRFG